ncbi:MAG: hypothetical protein AB8B64_27135 [Granulosicoccus sp.]
MRFFILCLSFVLLASPARAQTYAVVVEGLGGTADFQEAFSESSDHYSRGLLSLENDASLIIQLDETATRNDILATIEQQAARIQQDLDSANGESLAEPVFILILTGHGNADNEGWRFNVIGPDLSSGDLIAALNTVPASRQLVVLAASASGAALDSISQLGRVLVTATKSGGEINAVRFHTFLADAMQSDVADYDRNEILTIAEAYRFAEARTTEYFEQQNLLASEHSRLRGEEADNIAVALLGSLRDAKDDPVVASLLDERLGLEQTFKALRQRKSEMPVDVYYSELEILLLSIARLQQSIDEATGWSDGDANS